MNPRKSFQRRIIYLVAIVVLLAMLALLGSPATFGTKTEKGSPGGLLAKLRAEHKLSPAQLGEIDPTSEAVKLSTLGMRGVASLILWQKANEYKKKKDFSSMAAAVKQISKLEPNFLSVWIFQAWNLSFNVSVQFDDFRDRYRWVIRGVDYLEEGMKYNKDAPSLRWYYGWYIQNKIGNSDEKKQFRILFRNDADFHLGRGWMENIGEQDPRDSWLVAKWWFEQAEKIVDTKKGKMKGQNPLLFRSRAAMCQMYYSSTLEDEGTFGDRAQRAWGRAAEEWRLYGEDLLDIGGNRHVRLNDAERGLKKAEKLAEQLDALQPGLRKKIYDEKYADLTGAQREAFETPFEERTGPQGALWTEAMDALVVSHREVADRIPAPHRKKAAKLARDTIEIEKKAQFIQRYGSTVAFDDWRRRAKVEQEQDMLDARKFCYQGDQHYALAEFDEARENYDKGFAFWRKVLDNHPDLLSTLNFHDDIVDTIRRYQYLLREQTREPLPDDFILRDVWEEFNDRQ